MQYLLEAIAAPFGKRFGVDLLISYVNLSHEVIESSSLRASLPREAGRSVEPHW
jgi:hypothetical protein